jgi:chemotaxis protein MotB
MAARRQRHAEEEEGHASAERWLLTYADMITLLMVLFIVLFAIGQTDLKKFELLRQSLNNSLGGSSKVFSGGTGVLESQPSITAFLDNPGLVAAATQALAAQTKASQAKAEEQAALTRASQAIEAALAAHGLTNDVTFRIEPRGLVVTVVTDQVLFQVGSAVLQPTGMAVLNAIAPVLRNLPNDISIDGHTDNQPISGGQYPSNWELSTARATAVLRYLIATQELDPTRISASGYADTRPLYPNNTPAHMAANRRVEVVILNQVTVIGG